MFFEPFLLAGGFFFYLLLVIFAGFLFYAVEADSGWYASWTVIVFVIILAQATDIALFTWVLAHPLGAVKYVVYYFLIGSAWGVAKWYFYCIKLRSIARDVKTFFLNDKKISGTEIPDTMKDDFIKVVVNSRHYHDYKFPPQAMDHKSDWLMWATYWPISCAWTMINQPVKYVFEFVYAHLGGMMQKIANMVFKDI